MSSRILNAGDTFTPKAMTTFTVISSAVISDMDGNIIGSYDTGTTYQGVMPHGSFTVTSGSIKLWG